MNTRIRFRARRLLWPAAALLLGGLLLLTVVSTIALSAGPAAPEDVPGGITGTLYEPGGLSPSGGWIDIHDVEGHPWMGTTLAREDWTAGLDIKILAEDSNADVLYWVGCTGALVDRNIPTTQAVARLLKEAGVSFGCLGEEETCSGDPARRLGNEYLFQMQAQQTIEICNSKGVKKIIITHPLASFVNYSVEDMKEVLDLGATYLEHVFNDTTRQVGHPITREALFSGIKAIGAKHCIMSTDSGQWLNPVPAQQMGIYIQDMLNFGFSDRDVRTMVADNPARLLGL